MQNDEVHEISFCQILYICHDGSNIGGLVNIFKMV